MSLKTLDISLRLLEYFTEEKTSWGVRELAKKLEMNHSIIYRILSTFEKHGFLIQNQETKKYELGMRFWVYSQLVKEKNHLYEKIMVLMKDLNEKTGESIFLTGLDGNRGICLHFVESKQQEKYKHAIGTKIPLHAGSPNKVMMAYLPKNIQEEIMAKGLDPITKRTVINVDQLRAELAEIEKKGWAYSLGEYSDASFGISVPLFNYKNEILGSLSIGGPEYRVQNAEQVSRFLQSLQDTRKKIQEFIYHHHIVNF